MEGGGEQRFEAGEGPPLLQGGTQPFSCFGWVVVEEAVRDLEPRVIEGYGRELGWDPRRPPHSAYPGNLRQIVGRCLPAFEKYIDAKRRPPWQYVGTNLDTRRCGLTPELEYPTVYEWDSRDGISREKPRR